MRGNGKTTAQRAARIQEAPFYARIKPYNPKKGLTLQRYTVLGQVYLESKGWYPIDSEELARALKKLRVDENNEESPPVFDVCTLDEANQIDEQEARKARHGERRTARDASGAEDWSGTVTTRQIPTRSEKNKGKDAERLEKLRGREQEEDDEPDELDESLSANRTLQKLNDKRREEGEEGSGGKGMLDPDPTGAEAKRMAAASDPGRVTQVGKVNSAPTLAPESKPEGEETEAAPRRRARAASTEAPPPTASTVPTAAAPEADAKK